MSDSYGDNSYVCSLSSIYPPMNPMKLTLSQGSSRRDNDNDNSYGSSNRDNDNSYGSSNRDNDNDNSYGSGNNNNSSSYVSTY